MTDPDPTVADVADAPDDAQPEPEPDDAPAAPPTDPIPVEDQEADS